MEKELAMAQWYFNAVGILTRVATECTDKAYLINKKVDKAMFDSYKTKRRPLTKEEFFELIETEDSALLLEEISNICRLIIVRASESETKEQFLQQATPLLKDTLPNLLKELELV